jgi:hypothetical protein
LLGAGLIEGIQQICQYEEIDMLKEFNAWLLPLTKKQWNFISTSFKHN